VWLRKDFESRASVSALEQSWLGRQCGARIDAETAAELLRSVVTADVCDPSQPPGESTLSSL